MSRSWKNTVGREEGATVCGMEASENEGDREGLAVTLEGADNEGVGSCDGIDKRSFDNAEVVLDEMSIIV